jgi:hypothetical protein
MNMLRESRNARDFIASFVKRIKRRRPITSFPVSPYHGIVDLHLAANFDVFSDLVIDFFREGGTSSKIRQNPDVQKVYDDLRSKIWLS